MVRIVIINIVPRPLRRWGGSFVPVGFIVLLRAPSYSDSPGDFLSFRFAVFASLLSQYICGGGRTAKVGKASHFLTWSTWSGSISVNVHSGG